MKDEVARVAIRLLEERLQNIEEKAVVPHFCGKCGHDTAHKQILIKAKDGKYREVPWSLADCVGLHIEPGRRCLSCGAAYMLTHFAEVQLEGPK